MKNFFQKKLMSYFLTPLLLGIGGIFLFSGFKIFSLEHPLFQKEELFFWMGIMFVPYLLLFYFKDVLKSHWKFLLGISFLLQFLFLFMPPFFNDFFYYLWDGHVLSNGINPFRYSPWEIFDNPETKHLADVWYWDLMYFKWSTTIYGPTLEFLFYLANVLFDNAAFGLKFLFFLCNLGTLYFTLKILSFFKKDLYWIFLIALNPLFLFETLVSAHTEAVVLLFLASTFYFFLSKNHVLAGVSFAFLVMTKYFPILLFPLFLKHKGRGKFFTSFFITIVLGYLPLAWGIELSYLWKTIGTFSGEWVQSPGIFYLLENLLTFFHIENAFSFSKMILWAVVFFTVFWEMQQNERREDVVTSSYWILLVLLLTSSVVFPWYFLWLIFFLPFVKRKLHLMVFSFSLSSIYLLSFFSEKEQTFIFLENGEVFWSQFFVWGIPLIVLLVSYLYSKLSRKPIFKKEMISVIIPAWNESEFILRTLKSFEYFDEEHEIIVIDGGSTDGTIEKVEKYSQENSKVRLITSGAKGRGASMNAGAKMSRGSILFFLHADSQFTGNPLASILNSFSFKEYIGGAFPIRFMTESLLFRGIETYSNNRARFTKMFHGDQGIFIRKEIFNKIGGYPELPIMEDVSLSISMRKYGNTKLLNQKILTSPRRIEANGFLKAVYFYFLMKGLYYLGVGPQSIKNIYKRLKKE